jgi:hypothetical protein
MHPVGVDEIGNHDAVGDGFQEREHDRADDGRSDDSRMHTFAFASLRCRDALTATRIPSARDGVRDLDRRSLGPGRRRRAHGRDAEDRDAAKDVQLSLAFFGPVEWLRRIVTYRQRFPLLRVS